MRSRLVGLVDAGFISRSGRALLKNSSALYQGQELVGWMHRAATRLDMQFLRLYWYDGAYPITDSANYVPQRKYFNELESCPGIQLRLGHLEPRPFDFKPALRNAAHSMGIDYPTLMRHFKPEKIYQQKGVDTLLVLDMLRLVQQGACSSFVLMAGDRDLAEAVRTVQQLGATVILAHPEGAPVASELRDLADERVVWTEELMKRMTSSFLDRLDHLIDTDDDPE